MGRSSGNSFVCQSCVLHLRGAAGFKKRGAFVGAKDGFVSSTLWPIKVVLAGSREQSS